MPEPDRRAGFHHAVVATMALAEFLLITWIGMTVIGDTAGRSVTIALLLTLMTLVGLAWERRRAR